jgi:Zn-dependent protease
MNLELALISLVILIFSAIFHEIAHGLVAERLGDPTARLLGRLTLNPIPHIDPVMSILLPLILILGGSPVIFGAAKPVPVDPFNLREPRKDIALVSLAGPITNFLIAFLTAAIYNFAQPFIASPLLVAIIFSIIQINLLLGIFNLIPIPPLDGSKIAALFMPESTANKYLSFGQFGIFILFFLLMPFSPIPLSSFISNILNTLLGFMGF